MTAAVKKRRVILAALLGAAAAIVVIFAMFSVDSATNEIAVSYIEAKGWQIEKNPAEISHLAIPENFDIVYQTYNALQKETGFDLTDYKGKRVSRYSYNVLNHPRSESESVRINIIIFEDKVIAADISSACEGGFMQPLLSR